MPVASSTALVESLAGTFWDVISGPGVYILGVLLTISIVFFAYNRLTRKLR